MRRPPTKVVVPGLVGIYLLASIALAGCNKSTNSSSSNAPAPGGSDQASAGKKLFDANCMKCHSVSAAPSGGPGPGGPGPGGPRPGGPGGPGGPGPGGPGGGGKGPSLAKVGADPVHTRDWLADHVRDPKKHKPNSKMPAFGEKLKNDDILTLADYLASLK